MDTTTDTETAPEPNGVKTKAVIGRPTIFTDELATTILDRLAGGTTLLEICRDADMPGTTTVYRWRDENAVFRDRFAQARHIQMHAFADQSVIIADDGTTDYITKTGRNGVEYEAVDQEHIQRSRLRVDTRLRLMAVIAPHVYGPTVAVEHGGEVQHTHTASLSDREKMRRMALFMMEDDANGELIEGESSEVQATPPAKP